MGADSDGNLPKLSCRLTEGEVEIFGDDIPVAVDGFLRSISVVGGVERAQIKIPTDDIAPGSFRMIAVPRSAVRVPPMVRGPKI